MRVYIAPVLLCRKGPLPQLLFAVTASAHLCFFPQGWFNETLPAAPVERIAFLRLDGDLWVPSCLALGGVCVW